MIKKRLIELSGDSMIHVKKQVLFQWLGLCCNIILIFILSFLFAKLAEGRTGFLWAGAFAFLVLIGTRMVCIRLSSRESTLASKAIKKNLRENIYRKLLRIGSSYTEKISTAEVVQVTVEGVDQLETYFGAYLPQLFYSLLAPVTLFLVLCFIHWKSALILLICVPLIPISIVAVQKIAKKLLSKYWGQYAKLGDSFLENLQGLTTLKIYQADEYKHREMNQEAEHFRRVTMKVLTMQLNSIIVMDIVALGGAAVGIMTALSAYQHGEVTLFGMLVILLLAADFFLPMRQLGSYFHIAMNGMAASDKIFRLLDLKEDKKRKESVGDTFEFTGKNISYYYGEGKQALHEVSFHISQQGLTAFVGVSGSGKSTLAGILSGRLSGYEGSLLFGGKEISTIKEEELMKHITVVSMNSYLFGGTVRENLCMSGEHSDEACRKALEKVRLLDYLDEQQGLDTMLNEGASNLSGGQRQRLAMARALLADSPVYIFDEASSNVDVESEEQILKVIYELAKTKTILMISHRLAATAQADRIYVLDQGMPAGAGTHEELLNVSEVYSRMWNSQQQLEQYTKGGIDHEEEK